MSISKSDLGELAVVASSPKKEALRGVRGMNDILPVDEVLWQRFDEAVADVMAAYAYRRIRTPIVEHTRLFVRGIGEVTDIVEKEMYSFKDVLNGEHLSLRPENTAGAVRAVIEHNLLYDGPKRLWYTGPMFRHERPQKGRYRQFHQVGAEAMGFAGPDVDAELILLCQRLWDDLNLPVVSLEINSLGQPEERAAHRGALIKQLRKPDCQRRIRGARQAQNRYPPDQQIFGNCGAQAAGMSGNNGFHDVSFGSRLISPC